MSEHPIGNLMKTTLEEIRQMADASTIIGEPIISGSATIIPVSKISYGFASGGSDIPNKASQDIFGGGAGAGVTISPIAFIVINNSEVKLLQISPENTTADKALGMVPDLVDKIDGIITSHTKSKKPVRKFSTVETVE